MTDDHAIDLWIPPRERLDRFCDAALGRRVASFDVFDTVLWRRVAQPTHIFPLVEREIQAAFGAKVALGFAQARMDAETIARDLAQRAHGEVEVTFDEIYRALPRTWPRASEILAFTRQAELRTELAHVEVEPEVQQAYTRLKATGIVTIFVSDVYLGEADVRSLLVKCGYDGDDPLFVSSTHRRAKWDGSIWDLVTRSLGVSAGEIVHIGDNHTVDVEAARRAGLTAFHWPGRSRHNKFRAPCGPAIVPLSVLKTRDQSISQRDGDPTEFWPRLGRAYGTIIFGSFLRWLAERVETGVDHIYFCARDGQVMLDLWRELIEPHRRVPTSSYLYVSRRALMLPQMNRLTEGRLDFLCSGSEERDVRTYLDRAGLLEMPDAVARAEAVFGSLDAIIATTVDVARLRTFYRACANDLAVVADRSRPLVEDYLGQEAFFAGGRRIIVDLGWRGSLQRSLVQLIAERNAPTRVAGLYYGLSRDAGAHRGTAGWMEGMIGNDFMDRTRDRQLRQMVTILEQFHAADHGSVWGYARSEAGIVPVFRDNAVEQSQARDKMVPFQQAAAEELRQIFAGRHPLRPDDLDPDGAWAALMDLCLYPSAEESRLLGDLRFFDGFEHAGDGLPIAARMDHPSRDRGAAILHGHTWMAAALKNWQSDHPSFRDTVRELAHDQDLDPRWASQFR